jgi:phosphopantothenoylcysteine synthetase/decarboxylase
MNNILIGVTGGISAYKVPSIVSVLVDKGYDVRVIMTDAAKKFIVPLTFSAISHNPVYDDSLEFTGNDGHIWHVELAKWADAFVIAPMTANTGMKLINHIADNLLTSTAMAYHKNPILMFPAMNVYMWHKFKEAYMSNNGGFKCYTKLEKIEEFNFKHIPTITSSILVQPATGKMACGDIGEGKLLDTRTIVMLIEKMVLVC